MKHSIGCIDRFFGNAHTYILSGQGANGGLRDSYSYIVCCLFVMSILACQPDPVGSCSEVNYQDILELQSGDKYCFPDGLELAIVDIRNEYCPCFSVCVWEGQYVVDIDWTLPDGSTGSSTFNGSNNTLTESISDISIEGMEDSLIFDEECTESLPSPYILEVSVVVSR